MVAPVSIKSTIAFVARINKTDARRQYVGAINYDDLAVIVNDMMCLML